tara:strand:- start:178 stop:966 length:789 start_codon:yes stop_codon:yes gene_type:complete
MKREEPSHKLLIEWNNNPLINPKTKRKIKLNGPTYKFYLKYFKIFTRNKKNCRYIDMRINKIDPLLLIELPLNKNKIFEYKYKWNPYNGKIAEIDEYGPLHFDVNSLIHYFYINRLNHLWIDDDYNNNEITEGYYGDAVGNGPDFDLPSRGIHPDWYLFRLPILDCYLDKENHCYQSVTMGPILSDNDLKLIDNLSKGSSLSFKKTYKYKKPKLLKMKELYDKAISKNLKIDEALGNSIPKDELKYLKYKINIEAVEELKKL